MTVQITPAQIARIQRAMTESFVFRAVHVNGEPVVRVASASGNEYTVPAGGGCDCLDKHYHPETVCKHDVACSLWLQGADLPPATVGMERKPIARPNLSRDFPEDN